MTLSVIVTCYNLEKYVEQAILSILAQTRKADQVIVVDDCSTDHSASIIKKYSDQLMYLRMPENSGVLLATLEGIKNATGDILTFLDGDDIWLPDKLEEVAHAFEADPSLVLASHNYEIIDAEGRVTGQTDETQKNLERITRDHPDDAILSERIKDSILGYKGIWLGSAYCIKRKSFDLAGFDAFISSFPIPGFKRLCYQDHLIAQYVVLNNPATSRACLINKILFQYRIFGFNSSGVSNTLGSALRTIEKGHANMTATSTLVSKYPGLKEAQKIQHLRLIEFDYLKALYTKKYSNAIAKYIQLSFNLWNNSRKIKELKRLAGVIILGPEKFLAIKSRT